MKPIAYLTLNKVDYPILKVKEGYVAVDDVEVKKDKWFINTFNGIINKAQFDFGKDELTSPIIASTFPLEGVERFEMVDEAEIESQKHAKKEWPLWTYSKQFKACKNDFKSGYKAAQSKGLFTEEHARLIFNEGFAIGNSQKEESEGSEHFYDSDFERIIQSLLPRYEVEMEEGEEIHTGGAGSTSYPIFEQVPLTYEKDGVTYLKLKH